MQLFKRQIFKRVEIHFLNTDVLFLLNWHFRTGDSFFLINSILSIFTLEIYLKKNTRILNLSKKQLNESIKRCDTNI